MNIDKKIYKHNVSDLVLALEEAVKIINADVFGRYGVNAPIEIPFVVETGPRGKRAAYGWISCEKIITVDVNGEKKEVAHELMVALETLDRPIESTFLTLAHEMCHLYNIQRDIHDVNGGQRHNKKFAAACDVIGLGWKKDAKYGIVTVHTFDEYEQESDPDVRGQMQCNPYLIEACEKWIAKLAKSGKADLFKLGRISDCAAGAAGTAGARKKAKKGDNQIKYICSGCQKSFRATRLLNVICGDCNMQYIPNLPDAASSGEELTVAADNS